MQKLFEFYKHQIIDSPLVLLIKLDDPWRVKNQLNRLFQKFSKLKIISLLNFSSPNQLVYDVEQRCCHLCGKNGRTSVVKSPTPLNAKSKTFRQVHLEVHFLQLFFYCC